MATKYIEETKQIQFDPHDWKGIHELMDRHEKFKDMCLGHNEEGESVTISVNKENITVTTLQSNGWVRENIYHRDYEVEELYHRA